jgi:biopolymer transport protein ExbD
MKVETRIKRRFDIPVASMADIAFLLLIFFMVSSIADADREIPIRLPESRVSVQENKKYFNVWITKNGDCYFGSRKGTLEALTTLAQYRIVSNPEVRALVRAEHDTPYEYINGVLDSLKEGGLHNVVFVSKKK